MPPDDKPQEDSNGIYRDVHVHSPGMISFTYRPPSPEIAEELRKTGKYRLFDLLDDAPANPEPQHPAEKS